jgi:hypothetical protein
MMEFPTTILDEPIENDGITEDTTFGHIPFPLFCL